MLHGVYSESLLSCISSFLTLNLAQSSFKVIYLVTLVLSWTVYRFGNIDGYIGLRTELTGELYIRRIIVGPNFRSIFNRFGDIAGFIRPEPTVLVNARAHESYVCLTDIMYPATLHGVGVISLLSCISPFLRHLRNQWPWVSLRGHSRSYMLAAIESPFPCTT